MNKSIKFFIAIIGILTLFTIAACSGDTGENSKVNNDEEVTEKSGELVVYSSRNEKFMEPLLEKFEKESGITVNLLSGKDEIINKVKEEGKNAHADILISNDVGALEHLRQN